MRPSLRNLPLFLAAAFPCFLYAQQTFRLDGSTVSEQGAPIANVVVTAGSGVSVTSDAQGNFSLTLLPGITHITAHRDDFPTIEIAIDAHADQSLRVEMRRADNVSVSAGDTILAPDPSTSAYTSEELIAASPGRPGAPFSVPGFPSETASGGIKAPQYFAPGVAGDHGEPIAQFFQVGDFLFQNNLTANAHGNGYSDPNIVVPAVLSGVIVDNAAFNARYGDHSINLAVDYTIRDHLASFVQLTSDGRDGDIGGGWGSRGAKNPFYLAGEASLGNGFLARAEQRQQYKLNGLHKRTFGNHQLTLFGIAYYGFSRIPGPIPLDTPVVGDTIDLNQKDLTHTTLVVATDTWRPSDRNQLVVSGFARTYSLVLTSDFGFGLLQQSESRTVQGGNATYNRILDRHLSLLAGLDYRRDAPRNLDLQRADNTGHLQLETSNDLTISQYGPFAALDGDVGHTLHFYAGLRQDVLRFANTDKVSSANSYLQTQGVTSPKLTFTAGRPEGGPLPQLSLSFGKAFHANDPRIGSGTAHGALIVQSRQYQFIASKILSGTEFRLTLAHQTASEQLAKIDPDTGLQQNVGPSLNTYFTVMVRRRYSRGLLQANYSQANAIDRHLRQAVPEAPRLIIDALATFERLPYGLVAKSEYEYVGKKPLGDGFRGVPVQEIHLGFDKSFNDGVWIVSASGEIASGASGQTTETFALPGELAPIERVVGVPLRTIGSVSLRYQFKQ